MYIPQLGRVAIGIDSSGALRKTYSVVAVGFARFRASFNIGIVDIDISYPVLALISVVVCVGAMLQGSIGFGLGTFSVPVLLLIEPSFVPGPMLLVAFFLTLMLLRRERASVRFREVSWGIVGRGIGSAVVAVVFLQMASEWMPPLVAVLVLIALGIMASGWKLPITRRTLLGVGFMSGVLGTAASIGGPPLAMLYMHSDGGRVRGTLSGIFVAGTLLSVAALVVSGKFGLLEVKLTGLLVPGVIAGFLLSRRTARIADNGYLRPTIIAVSALAAVLSLVRYL